MQWAQVISSLSCCLVRAVLFIVGVFFQAMNAEKILYVENFLADVNLSNPMIFFVRNNLDVSPSQFHMFSLCLFASFGLDGTSFLANGDTTN